MRVNTNETQGKSTAAEAVRLVNTKKRRARALQVPVYTKEATQPKRAAAGTGVK